MPNKKLIIFGVFLVLFALFTSCTLEEEQVEETNPFIGTWQGSFIIEDEYFTMKLVFTETTVSEYENGRLCNTALYTHDGTNCISGGYTIGYISNDIFYFEGYYPLNKVN